MASSFAVCRLHMRGRGSLFKCLRRIDTIQHRCARTLRSSLVQLAALRPHEKENTSSRSVSSDEKEKEGQKSLYVVEAERQEQAQRSVLISLQPRSSEKKVLSYLSKFGHIKTHFLYESFGMYALVEFTKQESVSSLLAGASLPSFDQDSLVPFKSRLLSLSNVTSADSLIPQSGQQTVPQFALPIKDLIERLSRETTIDQQVTSLTEAYQLTEENTRLRFLVCSLLQDITAAFFPECTVRLFGSSVNGFGKLGCDLDMFLNMDDISGRNVRKPMSSVSLEYQMKMANSERAVTQSILSVIGECVDQFGPGCLGVQKILQARCPLVRFVHQPSGFQCDLTANNRVAMKSTELLYLYGQLDPRVRHLVFAVRCWARAHNVTSSIPGAWITNFSLTMMVLFFLQTRSPPIIPTLDHLQALAGPGDKCLIEGHNCTFVSDVAKIKLHNNGSTLKQLLGEFFEFYASFAFNMSSINIRKGRAQNKPAVTPMYIQNPFEQDLNVSKNVNASHLTRFVSLCQESSWVLEQNGTFAPGRRNGRDAPQPWGLATLLQPLKTPAVKGRSRTRPHQASDRMKGLLESLMSKKKE